MRVKPLVLTLLVCLGSNPLLLAQTPTVIDFEQFTGPSVFTGVQPPLVVGVATFSGGQLLTGTINLPANQSTVYGTAFFCSGCLPTLTIDFSQQVSDFSVLIMNGQTFTVTYTVQDDQGGSQTITLVANLQSGAGVVSLPSTGITQVTVSGSAASWDFFIDNVTFVPCSVGAATATTNENCDPNVNPQCSANIVLADGSEPTDVSVQVDPPQEVEVDLTASFGDIEDVTTDSAGTAVASYTAGVLPLGGTSTTAATVSATICEVDFSDLEQIFNYRGFDFHTSNVTDAEFTDSSALDTTAIQDFLVAQGSFLARFVLVGGGAGFLDQNGNGMFDPGEPTYSPRGTPVPVQARGTSAAAILSRNSVGVNPKILLATAQKENSLITQATLPSVAVLNFAMGCGSPSDFVDQIRCAARTFHNRFNDRTAFRRPVAYPFFFRANDGFQHAVTDMGLRPVGFAVTTAATYAQYRYTPFIQSLETGGGVFLFESLWNTFGF